MTNSQETNSDLVQITKEIASVELEIGELEKDIVNIKNQILNNLPPDTRMRVANNIGYYLEQSSFIELSILIKSLPGNASKYGPKYDVSTHRRLKEMFDDKTSKLRIQKSTLAKLKETLDWIKQSRISTEEKFPNFSVSIGEIVMGDIFKNIEGSTIINRATVEKSFNKVQKDFDENVAKALVRLADEIQRSGNIEAGELFEHFNKELQEPKPKKSVLKSLWSSILEILPSISSIVEIATTIPKLFT